MTLGSDSAKECPLISPRQRNPPAVPMQLQGDEAVARPAFNLS